MKLAIVVLLANAYLLYKGLMRPYYCVLAYLWLACLYPGAFLPDPFRTLPLPSIAIVLAIGGYLLVGPRKLPRITMAYVLVFCFVVWVTCSTAFWAVFPADAWFKWKWVITSISIPLLMPFYFRTRREIEAVVVVVLFALSAHVATAAVKVLNGGGGYGTLATLVRDNTYLGESSTLATVAITCIPLAIYIIFHSLSSSAIPFRRLSIIAYMLIATAAMVGTSARAGLLALSAYLLLAVRRVGQKVLLCGCAVLIAYVALPYLPASWTSRMKTIETYNEDSSAEGRLKVWAWTYAYATEHPQGGGFDVYKAETFEGSMPIAFHSIYFELLGEQGFVGASLYLLIIGNVLWGFYRMSRNKRNPEWVRYLSRALAVSLIVYSVGGAFIGVAYQPLGYTMFGLYLCLRQCVADNLLQGVQIQSGTVPTCYA